MHFMKSLPTSYVMFLCYRSNHSWAAHFPPTGISEAPGGLRSSGQSRIGSLTILAPVAGTQFHQDDIPIQKCRSCKTCPQIPGTWAPRGLRWATCSTSAGTNSCICRHDFYFVPLISSLRQHEEGREFFLAPPLFRPFFSSQTFVQ